MATSGKIPTRPDAASSPSLVVVKSLIHEFAGEGGRLTRNRAWAWAREGAGGSRAWIARCFQNPLGGLGVYAMQCTGR